MMNFFIKISTVLNDKMSSNKISFKSESEDKWILKE